MAETTPQRTTERERLSQLTASERYALLSADRRRVVLDVLADRASPIDLEELAREVAAREGGLDPTAPERLKCVQISLHHVHLPKMAHLGVLEYERDSNRIRL